MEFKLVNSLVWHQTYRRRILPPTLNLQSNGLTAGLSAPLDVLLLISISAGCHWLCGQETMVLLMPLRSAHSTEEPRACWLEKRERRLNISLNRSCNAMALFFYLEHYAISPARLWITHSNVWSWNLACFGITETRPAQQESEVLTRKLTIRGAHWSITVYRHHCT